MRITHHTVITTLACLAPLGAQGNGKADSDFVIQALQDEMQRGLTLTLEDLEKPYFLQCTLTESKTTSLSAAYGAIVSRYQHRSRDLRVAVRCGSYDLDNTNFTGDFSFFGSGGIEHVSVPIDADYVGVRQAAWLAMDAAYKQAIETLTKKRAYIKDKDIADRPPDFVKVDPVVRLDAPRSCPLDEDAWRDRLRQLSARLARFEFVRDSNVSLSAAAETRWLVTSEGTRLRTGDTGVHLGLWLQGQAEEGQLLSASKVYRGLQVSDLPTVEAMLKDIDELAARLQATMTAPILKEYTGPVLFDGIAAGQVFHHLLAGGVVGRPTPIGNQRTSSRGSQSLARKLGRRILPKDISVHDDPRIEKHGETWLLGHYLFDDEGVPAQRVDIVQHGMLKDMAMSRVPTRKLKGSNGHGRGSTPTASVGCLFVESSQPKSAADLKAALLATAKDEGLDFAIRIEALSSGSQSAGGMMSMFMGSRGDGLPDPVAVYRVYVADGREELVRGCEFGPLTARALRGILATGTKQAVYNAGSTSIIAPPVLFDDLDLFKIEQEHEKKPILQSPHTRK